MFRKQIKYILGENSILRSPKNIRAQILEENRRFIIIWSIVHVLYWGYCLFMSTKQHDFMVCRHIYSIALMTTAVSLLLALFVLPRVPGMIPTVAVLVNATFIGAGIAVALHLAPKTIIIFASVLITPVLFICDFLSSVVLIVVGILVFAVVGRSGMADPSAYGWTITNMILFSSLGLILGFFVNRTRYERYVFADSAMKLAEMQTRFAYDDQLTGMHNRRAYSELLSRFESKMPAYCCVVMVDINGLKEINDRFGHEAGDELIIASAECLQKGFEGLNETYRIGGDEFCVVITDPGISAEECLKRTEDCCAGWKGKAGNKVSLSYGYADSNEFHNIDSIQKSADQRMYQFKREYYQRIGADRRRR